MSQAWFHVKQTPGAVGGDLTGAKRLSNFPLECLKKARTGGSLQARAGGQVRTSAWSLWLVFSFCPSSG